MILFQKNVSKTHTHTHKHIVIPDRGKAHINLYQRDYKVRDLLIMAHRYHLMLYLLIVKVHLNGDLSIKYK